MASIRLAMVLLAVVSSINVETDASMSSPHRRSAALLYRRLIPTTRLFLRGGLAEAMTAAESCASSAPTSKEFHSSTDVGRDASERTLMSSMVKRQASGEVDETRSGRQSKEGGEGAGGVKVSVDRVLGNGTFGTVFEGRLEDGTLVAVKSVLQDPRFRNRELSIMRPLTHPNVVRLISFFYTAGGGGGFQPTAVPSPPAGFIEGMGGGPGDVMLNLVMDFMPDTLHRWRRIGTLPASIELALSANPKKRLPVAPGDNCTCIKMRSQQGKTMPHIETKIYAWQLLRALAYLHRRGVCHRDVKPQNLLVDPSTLVAKICDLGSAKRLTSSSTSISYICSRFYRAPELIMGATRYRMEVDIWSYGCVLGEVLLGAPLFTGDSSAQQLAAIAAVIGVPSPSDIVDMVGECAPGGGTGLNESAVDIALKGLLGQTGEGWKILHRAKAPKDAIDLLSEILIYSPKRRKTAIEIMAHPYFDELRGVNRVALPGGMQPPNLFSLTPEEISWGRETGLLERILPSSFAFRETTPVTSPNDTPCPLASRGPSPGM